ncbi:hypothetical protein ACFVYE_11980 [Streptomyces sp. NPDC058239]|uniref:hypothetical protein n=1 Tax=unclassified Streptomyces TaxID=2593676 RepID=UPI003661EF7A
MDRLALTILVFAVAQLLLTRCAGYAGHHFGERTLARIREQFAGRVLAPPAPVVERAHDDLGSRRRLRRAPALLARRRPAFLLSRRRAAAAGPAPRPHHSARAIGPELVC